MAISHDLSSCATSLPFSRVVHLYENVQACLGFLLGTCCRAMFSVFTWSLIVLLARGSQARTFQIVMGFGVWVGRLVSLSF